MSKDLNQLDSKEPVRLRKRKLKSGRVSLYLDIYVKGDREYEYLNLYLVPEATRADKAKNKETMRFAEAILTRRIEEVRRGVYGFPKKQENYSLFEYFERVIAMKSNTARSTQQTWRGVYEQLKLYSKDLPLHSIDADFVEGFKTFLLTSATCRSAKDVVIKLSHNSASLYYSKFKTLFNIAVKDDLIPSNPCNKVSILAPTQVEKSYLTLEEVKMMGAVDFRDAEIKRAFLFSCLTGLRKSDVRALTWRQVETLNGNTRIVFRQKKTGGLEYMDISQQAATLMGERGKDFENVFHFCKGNNQISYLLRAWARQAGVKKDVTFHTARHSFAVIMLDLGVDIYTVQKLLGHRNIQTTEVYSKILDKNKRIAVDKIPDIFV